MREESLQPETEWTGLEVAVIGLAARFPQAPDAERFWRNLAAGVESVRTLDEDVLLAAGVDDATLRDPCYIRAVATLDGIELFDAAFFGFSPREAEIMDPQHRLFLECAWEAVEDAGYAPESCPRATGVYAGAGVNSYALVNLYSNPELVGLMGYRQARIGNRIDNLSTQVCYRLDLQGPGITVQTTCSTSIVATHLACQAVLAGDCDMALAGGTSVSVPQEVGYRYEEGGVVSADGHCRAFDSRASGFVHGNGAGVVVLKRLEDALADGDNVRAVLRGSAVNNDGGDKVGYSAPSVAGQAQVIHAAQTMAEVSPETISYVEAHGTATPIGDPIELAALKQVWNGVQAPARCGLGSVKTNIGHLDTAAGVAGLIKTVLALEKRQIPPSLHFESPNPELGLEDSPFYVNTELADWPSSGAPRRAGVSSFGIGGTNAHVVLEEAPARQPSGPSRELCLLPLSARSPETLDAVSERLAGYLRDREACELADVAWTLQVGRRAFGHRRAVVCRDAARALEVLEGRDPRGMPQGVTEHDERPVVFLFPGQGAQYPGMAAELHRQEEAFRGPFEEVLEALEPVLARHLRRLVLAPSGDGDTAELRQTRLAQPALFAVEYALARLWMEWGLEPVAMLGHSVGEWVAATLAGVLSLPAAARLVAERGRLVQSMPGGSMLAVSLAVDELESRLSDELCLAAVNGPQTTVVSGPVAAVDELQARLEESGIDNRLLHTSHAFHSPDMEPAARAFAEQVARVELAAPRIPFLSNFTGTAINDDEATDPEYWGRQLRHTVRFGDGLKAMMERFPDALLLEVGPGRTLVNLARRNSPAGRSWPAVASLPKPGSSATDSDTLLGAVGRLWVQGARIDWRRFSGPGLRHRVPLPTYPFERQRYWVEPGRGAHSDEVVARTATRTDAAGAGHAESLAGHSRPALSAAFVAPRKPLESTLADVWQRLLGVGQVGVHDDFFDLGGDSLLATRVASHLNRELAREVPLALVLEVSTIAELAARIADLPRAEEAGPALRPVPRDRSLPLSFAQQRLWFLDQLTPGSDAYNLPAAVQLEQALDVGALASSLTEIVRRHEVLRTVYESADGQPVQRVEAPAAVVLPVVDLEGLAPEERRRERDRRVRSEAAGAFDLRRSPLLRATLLRLASERHVLLLTLHHIAFDGWSWSVLFRELAALYPALTRGEPSPLAELPIQYADYSEWQRQWLTPALMEAQISYWSDRLGSGLPVFKPAGEKPHPAHPNPPGDRRSRLASARLTSDLGRISGDRGATLFMGLVSVFLTVMHHYSGQDDLVLGTDVANRRRPELEGLIGFFVNQLVLRVDLTGAPSFGELVDRVRRVTLEAQAHQDLPFDRLVDALKPEGDRFSSPFFQWKLVLQNNPTPERPAGGALQPETLPLRRRMVKFDLLVNLTETSEGLRTAVEYRTDLYDGTFVERLLDDFETVLAAAVRRVDTPLSDLEALLAEAGEQRATEDKQAAGTARRRAFERLTRRTLPAAGR